MKKYNNFREYMEDVYYDEIFNKIKDLVYEEKDSFESYTIYSVLEVELCDIHISGVTFKDLGNDNIEIRTLVDANIAVTGKRGRDYETDSIQKTYNVFFTAKLDNELLDVKITDVTEYNKVVYDKEKTLSQNWLPYMHEEDIDKYAEDFLKRYHPQALLQDIPVNPFDVVKAMGMRIYYAPLGDNIFGMTFFYEETVTVFENITNRNVVDIVIAPGTMLINPDVFFMRSIGTAFNTIIHECVHWDRHRRAFILQKILKGEGSHISCKMVEGEYNGIALDDTFKWMEW